MFITSCAELNNWLGVFMLGWYFKKLRIRRELNSQKSEKEGQGNPQLQPAHLFPSLSKNLQLMRNIVGTSPDIIYRLVAFGPDNRYKAALIFLDGIATNTTIHDDIIKPLTMGSQLHQREEIVPDLDYISQVLIAVGNVKKISRTSEVVDSFLSGSTILFLDGTAEALALDTRGWASRGIVEPQTEMVVRGPREGFTETLRDNIALLRRKIQYPGFTVESMVIGRKTHTQVAIAYIKGLTNPELIKELKHRLQRIDIDAVLESGYIEQLIEDSPLSFFPTVGNSEKPDKIAGKILEGRAAVLIDGTPFILTVPYLFIEGFMSAEDYYVRPFYANLLRLLRFVAFLVSLVLPAAYVAVSTFHQELLPTNLLITMASASAGTPFPAVLEALGMSLVFEILREGSLHLPRQVGSAVTIVGALVLGDAVISAGIVGAPMVIVIATTALASFLVVPYIPSTTVLRFILIIMAGFLGGFGLVLGLLAILVHLCALRSFGVPYLSPIAPLDPEGMKDSLVRLPWWKLSRRPRSINPLDQQRQVAGTKPGAPK